MNPRHGVRLGARNRWEPAVIEHNKHGANACLIRELQKRIDPRFQSRRICLPREIMQINTDAIHTHFGGPAKLALNGGGVKSFGLPHLKLVASGAGNEVATHPPGLSLGPGVCALF